MGEGENGRLRLDFDGHLRLEFRRARVTTDAGLLAVRELDGVLGLTEMAGVMIQDGRTGRNIRHELTGLLRQSIYARLAGYEDVNDHERLFRIYNKLVRYPLRFACRVSRYMVKDWRQG